MIIVTNDLFRARLEIGIDDLVVVDDIDDIHTNSLFGQYTYLLINNHIDERIFKFDNVYQVVQKVDKRSKIYKQNKDNFTILSELTPNTCSALCKSIGIDASPGLCAKCNNMVGIVKNTVEQLRIEPNIEVYDYGKDLIFELCKKFIAKKEYAYELEHCKKINESPLAILSALSYTAKTILQLQTCNDISIAGIKTYVAKQYKAYLNIRSNKWLINCIHLCAEVEYKIKIGLVSDWTLLQLLLKEELWN